jgi:hypothetical protein
VSSSPVGLRRERAQLLCILFASVACWVAFRLYTGIVLEDALITWRYAEHLAGGAGFTFNAGERVLGTTTPLLTVMLAGATLLTGTGAMPVVAVVLMIACGAATGWVVYHTLRAADLTPFVSMTATAALLLHPDIVWSTVGGMETPLLLLLMSLSLFGAVTRRYYVAAIACAGLPFVRPDAMLWVLLVVLYSASHGLKRIARPAAAGMLLAVAAAAALTVYFGSPLPHSVTAKRSIGATVGDQLTWYGLQQWFHWIMGASGVDPYGGRIERVAIVPWLGLVAIGSRLLLRTPASRRLWPLVVFPPSLAVAYLMSAAPHFIWYLVPLTACLCIAGAAGLGHLFETRWPAASLPGRLVIGAAAVLVVAAFAHTMKSAADWHWRNQRNEWQVRQAAGLWLRNNTTPDATVLMEAIGYQGTFSDRKVIDLAGLITPRVVELQRESRSNAEAFAKIIGEFAPDYIVLRTAEVEQNQHFHGGVLFQTPEAEEVFRSVYRPVATYQAPYPEIWFTAASVTIYSRRGR